MPAKHHANMIILLVVHKLDLYLCFIFSTCNEEHDTSQECFKPAWKVTLSKKTLGIPKTTATIRINIAHVTTEQVVNTPPPPPTKKTVKIFNPYLYSKDQHTSYQCNYACDTHLARQLAS